MPRMKLDYAPLGQQNYLTKGDYRSFVTRSMENIIRFRVKISKHFHELCLFLGQAYKYEENR